MDLGLGNGHALREKVEIAAVGRLVDVFPIQGEVTEA
jgi:hypothetical protein